MHGTQAYPRLRFGIGNDYPQGQLINYVLGDFSEEQRQVIPEQAKKAIAGIRTWAFAGMGLAMNQLNTRPKAEEEGA